MDTWEVVTLILNLIGIPLWFIGMPANYAYQKRRARKEHINKRFKAAWRAKGAELYGNTSEYLIRYQHYAHKRTRDLLAGLAMVVLISIGYMTSGVFLFMDSLDVWRIVWGVVNLSFLLLFPFVFWRVSRWIRNDPLPDLYRGYSERVVAEAKKTPGPSHLTGAGG